MQLAAEPMSKVFQGMTLAQEQEYLAAEMEENARALERFNADIAARKVEDYHANCNLCGRFTPKEAWIAKASAQGQAGKRPLCSPCWNDCDFGH